MADKGPVWTENLTDAQLRMVMDSGNDGFFPGGHGVELTGSGAWKVARALVAKGLGTIEGGAPQGSSLPGLYFNNEEGGRIVGEFKDDDDDDEATDDDRFLLLKRGLYYRPNSNGYTGFKERAGRYPESWADEMSGVSAVHEDEAAEISPGCFDDLARDWLNNKLSTMRAALRDIAEAEAIPNDAVAFVWCRDVARAALNATPKEGCPPQGIEASGEDADAASSRSDESPVGAADAPNTHPTGSIKGGDRG